MGIDIVTYFNIKEMKDLLRNFYTENGQDAVFIVPSGLDTEELTDLICGETAYFGDRPQVMTVGGLNSELAETAGVRRRVIDPPDHNLILKYLMELYLREAESLGTELPKGTSYSGFVALLGENIKDLLNEEITPEQMQAAVFGDGEPPAGFPETLLLELYQKYTDYLDSYNLADAAQLPTLARALLNDERCAAYVKSKKILFAGFLTFTGAQLRLVRALAELTDLTMLQPETGLKKFHDGTVQLLNFPKELKNKIKSAESKWELPTVLFCASSPHLEFEALARETALWAGGSGRLQKLGRLGDYGEIAVVVPPHRLELMKYALGRYNIPFNEQVRGTVGDTLLGDLPMDIWNVWKFRFDTYYTKLLLANPLLTMAGPGGKFTADGVFPDSFASWTAALPKQAADTLRNVKNFCMKLEEGGAPLAILKTWLDFIEQSRCAELCASAAGDLPSLDQTVKDISYAVYELKKKIKRLEDTAADMGPAASVNLRGADAAAFISDWSRTATLPIQLPQSRSVTVYAGTPPILCSHRFIIMTDVDYNSWPGTLRESLLFRNANKVMFNETEKERAKTMQADGYDAGSAHLPELSEEREQKEALFRRLTAAASDGVIIARSSSDMKKDPVGESVFTANMTADGRWPVAASVDYPSDCAMPDGSSPWFPEAEIPCVSSSMGTPHAVPVGKEIKDADDVQAVVPISALDTWKSCPYLYWCTSKLRLSEPRETLWNNMDAGTLFHKIWEECMTRKAAGEKFSILSFALDGWERFKKENYPALAEDKRLARFEKELKDQALRMADIQDTIEKKAEAAGRTAVAVETALGDYEANGVIFHAKADRIDYYGNEAVVLDYKLGSAANHLKELQVPAYCRILSELTGTEIKGFGWLGHRDGELRGFFSGRYAEIYACPESNAGKNQADPVPRIQEAADAMKAMAEDIKTGVYLPHYDAKDVRCRNCAFFVLCRKREESAFADIDETENSGVDGGMKDEL